MPKNCMHNRKNQIPSVETHKILHYVCVYLESALRVCNAQCKSTDHFTLKCSRSTLNILIKQSFKHNSNVSNLSGNNSQKQRPYGMP